ncbi:MAG: sensor domain-containing diguanylate cyclase [Candidatus Omnitrophica bacterium]|jgi:diguanylate cyclase (GGDEF)-like protein|nr:sensor domain-containing diguanylate cyclase [Candidatus Omnitrophota bacterium]
MAPRVSLIPSFFLPIAAFLVWSALFFSYLPILEKDFDFARQIILVDLYLSNIILILTWFLCGRILFIVFAAIVALLAAYLMLDLGEPGMGVHIVTVALLYLWLKHITDKIGREKLAKMMERDRIQESLNLAQKALEERSRLLAALSRKLERLQYMREFSDHLKSADNLEATGRIIVQEVAGLVPEADRVLLYVSEESSEGLGLIAQMNRRGGEEKAKRGNEFDDWVIKRSQPLLIEDIRTDFRFLKDASEHSLDRSLCAVPLVSKSTVCGVLRLTSEEPGMFQTDDLRLMDIVADLSAVVIRNILLYQKTRELSIIDSLTDCYLLRYVQERVTEEIQRSARHSTPFSIIMADIDHFKKYNDEFGHTAGDFVLRNVADLLRAGTGPTDIVGRYGGEEFIIILPQKSAAEAAVVAEALRASIEAKPFKLRRETRTITMSFGVAQYPSDGVTRDELIQKADERLYQAKRSGRNRVVA